MEIQTIAAILFVLILTVFLLIKRKKIAVQKILFPILYFAMYRTNWGIRSMDRAANRFRKPLTYWSYFGVFIGFLGMGLIAFELIFNLYRMLSKPGGAAGVGIIQPFAPHIPGTIFVPFFYFVISIFFIAVIHEFSHGVIARACKLKIKSSGFAFLGLILPILPAAFVEPDEKQMQKKSTVQQLSIFAAGPFSNILMAFVVLGLFFVIFTPISKSMLEPQGMLLTDFLKDESTGSPAENAGIQKGELMTQINGISLKEPDALNKVINEQKPGETVIITTNKTVYRIVLGEKPAGKSRLKRFFDWIGIPYDTGLKESKPFLGVMARPHSIVKESFKEQFGNITPKIIAWFAGLFQWLFILSLGIGLFNLVPLGPIDGGRMLKTVLNKYCKEEQAHKTFYWVSTICLFALFANIFLAIIG